MRDAKYFFRFTAAFAYSKGISQPWGTPRYRAASTVLLQPRAFRRPLLRRCTRHAGEPDPVRQRQHRAITEPSSLKGEIVYGNLRGDTEEPPRTA